MQAAGETDSENKHETRSEMAKNTRLQDEVNVLDPF